MRASNIAATKISRSRGKGSDSIVQTKSKCDTKSSAKVNAKFNAKPAMAINDPASSVCINVKHCKYPVIPDAASSLGWFVEDQIDDLACKGIGLSPSPATGDVSRSDRSHILWLDSGLFAESILRKCESYQRINHIPGMVGLYRKNYLTRTMARMQRVAPTEYSFYPKSWLLPHDATEVNKYLEECSRDNLGTQNKCLIVKPSGGAQGKGIYLALNPLSEEQLMQSRKDGHDAVAQVS
jgi:hypothetical protein